MLGFPKLFLAGVAAAASLIATGCASDNKPAQSSLAASDKGVICTKCQTTWVKVPRTEKGRVVGYTPQKRHVCPDCKDAVTNFFTTGNLQHTCKTCGETMEICEAH